MRQRTITVSGDAIPGRSWRASVAGGSGWLEVTPTQDTVPSSVAITLKPDGLALGSYEDTVLVSSDMGDPPVQVPVRFLVQAGPTPPPPPPQGTSQLVIIVQPTSGTAGRPINPPVVVVAQDASGRIVNDFAGDVTVALGSNSGAILGGNTTVSASAGVATFSDLTVNRRGTGYTLLATAAGFTGIQSKPFDMADVPVSASRSTLSVSRNTIVASNGSSTTTITVTAADEQGNPVAGASVTITASGGGNTIAPSNGTTDASGRMNATLSSTGAGSKTISAVAGGVTIGTAASVQVTPASAAQLTFSVQPADAVEDRAIRPPIQVTTLDQFGNFAPDFYGAVTLTLTRGRDDARLQGTVTVGAIAGIATFDNVSVSRDGNNYAITASSSGLGSVESSTFRVRKN
jgi:hypothetical protein